MAFQTLPPQSDAPRPLDKEASDRLFERIFVPLAILSILIVGIGLALAVIGQLR
jgi:hypothetical protein